MGVRCVECAGGFDHCHGALVRHDELLECTDSACSDADPRRHALRVGCAEAFGAECCAPAIGRCVYSAAS